MNCCNQSCNQGRDCPNRKRKMNTRKYPRTLNEAFGPYGDNRTHYNPRSSQRRALAKWGGFCVFALFCVAVITVASLGAK